jgi:Putative phage abortive infection protein
MASNPENQKEEKDIDFVFTSIIVTLVIVGLWIGTFFLLKDKPDTSRGTFGDMFGSINALFSGLALAGIILTILLQRKELKLQREELRDTRTEFETQNETLKLQRFESTFFNLLNLHHQIVNAIDFRYYKRKEKNSSYTPLDINEEKEVVTITGRDVFRYRYKAMYNKLKASENKFEEVYLANYAEAQTDFGHYFRNLYRMIKLVDQTDFFYNSSRVSKEEIFMIKYRYTCIIRSQISDYELLWLFYNCLSINGSEKFKPLIEQYSIFKNIPKDLIANIGLVDKYKKTAYEPTIPNEK